jgi:hypothetical protein
MSDIAAPAAPELTQHGAVAPLSPPQPSPAKAADNNAAVASATPPAKSQGEFKAAAGSESRPDESANVSTAPRPALPARSVAAVVPSPREPLGEQLPAVSIAEKPAAAAPIVAAPAVADPVAQPMVVPKTADLQTGTPQAHPPEQARKAAGTERREETGANGKAIGKRAGHKRAKHAHEDAEKRHRTRTIAKRRIRSRNRNLADGQETFQTAAPQAQWIEPQPASTQRVRRSPKADAESGANSASFFGGPNPQ